MPNRIITGEEFMADMKSSARRTVDQMAMTDVEKLAANPFEGPAMGIRGAVAVMLVLAARDRMQYEADEIW
jgi:hypothetical protein